MWLNQINVCYQNEAVKQLKFSSRGSVIMGVVQIGQHVFSQLFILFIFVAPRKEEQNTQMGKWIFSHDKF